MGYNRLKRLSGVAGLRYNSLSLQCWDLSFRLDSQSFIVNTKDTKSNGVAESL